MNVYILYIVTTLGVLLSLFSVLFISRGKSIAGVDGSPQMVRFGGVEARTNLIMTLLIVSVMAAVLPLCLEFYLILVGAIGVSQQAPEAAPTSEIIPMPEIAPALNTIGNRQRKNMRGIKRQVQASF